MIKKLIIIISILIFTCKSTVVAAPVHLSVPVNIRPHVTLQPVEPGFIPDPNCYYVEWLDDLKITYDDFKLMCYTIQCEAGNQSLEAQRLCAVTILNRIYDKRFPNTMSEVIYQRNPTQFDVIDWSGFPEAYPYSDQVELACYLSIATMSYEPRSMLFFRSKYYFEEYIPYTDDGDMYFSLKE